MEKLRKDLILQCRVRVLDIVRDADLSPAECQMLFVLLLEAANNVAIQLMSGPAS